MRCAATGRSLPLSSTSMRSAPSSSRVDGPFGHDDLPAGGLSLEPGRGVHHVADGGEVVDVPLADVADEGLTEVDADPDLDEGPGRGAVADGPEQTSGVVDHQAGDVGAGQHGLEVERHDLVPDELVDDRLGEQRLLGAPVEAAEDAGDVLGVACSDERVNPRRSANSTPVSILAPPGGDSSMHIEHMLGFFRDGRNPRARVANRPTPANGAAHIWHRGSAGRARHTRWVKRLVRECSSSHRTAQSSAANGSPSARPAALRNRRRADRWTKPSRSGATGSSPSSSGTPRPYDDVLSGARRVSG